MDNDTQRTARLYEISLKALLEGDVDRIHDDVDVLQHLGALESFIGNERFSDVKFKVGGKEIFAHKMILSAHSPVFAAMFEHQMRENGDNVVTIEDISYEVFYELLRFVYSAKCNLAKGIVSDLFKAADKYQLLGLQSMCEIELGGNMSINDVFDVLRLADMHNAVDLRSEAIDFIVNSMTELIDRPELETLKNLDMNLFREILQQFVQGIFSGAG